MAAKYPSFATAAADDLTCPICFHMYVTPHEPKNLPKCSHMCCSLCLKKMTEGGLKIVKCPQCNKVSNLPEEGVDGLTTSLTVRNLADKHPEGIKQRKEHIKHELEQLKPQKAEMLKAKEETKKEIQELVEREVREVEKAVESVMTQAQEIIGQIRDASRPILSQTQQEITQLKQQIEDIEQSQTKLETMADGEFQTQTDALVNQVGRMKLNDSTVGEKEDHCVSRFVPQNVQLGRLVKPRKLELVHEFSEFEVPLAVASNSNGILAVYDEESDSKQVLTFKYDNGGYKKLSQSKILETFDVAVSADDKLLIPKEKGGFDVCSLDGKCQRTVQVTTEQSKNVESVSVTTTRDGRILVGSRIDGEGGQSNIYFITVHDTSGNILKTIPVSLAPLRIADVHGTHVAVTDFGDKHKVCVYDLETGKETLTLDILLPLGICHDEVSNCLLIGRVTELYQNRKPKYGSCVIEQYCSVTGKLVATLAQGLVCPIGMTITHNGMLAVADSKTVKVYTMK